VSEESKPEPAPWGHAQPKFQRIEREGEEGFVLVGVTTSGEPIRVQLEPAPRFGG
jgi:hypothetical protein